MTATAQFPASYVLRRAEERIANVEEQRAEVRRTKIDALMMEPVLTGYLWWKRRHYRTAAEADLYYRNGWRGEWYGSPEYWDEGDHRYTLRKLCPLRNLAKAADEANHLGGKVSLDAADCLVLAIPTDRKEFKA